MPKNINNTEKFAFFLFEGDTEETFYKDILNSHLSRSIPRHYKNLETGCGINREVAKHLSYFIQRNPSKKVYTYVFLDREGSRSKIPEFNAKQIKLEVEKVLNTKQIGKIAKIEAVQMIESWFFYDLEGILKYIGIPYSDSLYDKYKNPESLRSSDLAKLFLKGSRQKYYKKGDEKFLEKLDKDKIYNLCKDLKDGIDMINNDFVI
jgi:hypothetical protein